MKKLKISLSILLLIVSFNALSQDWDAWGNPTHPPVKRPDGDMSGDVDAMGHPR